MLNYGDNYPMEGFSDMGLGKETCEDWARRKKIRYIWKGELSNPLLLRVRINEKHAIYDKCCLLTAFMLQNREGSQLNLPLSSGPRVQGERLLPGGRLRLQLPFAIQPLAEGDGDLGALRAARALDQTQPHSLLAASGEQRRVVWKLNTFIAFSFICVTHEVLINQIEMPKNVRIQNVHVLTLVKIGMFR